MINHPRQEELKLKAEVNFLIDLVKKSTVDEAQVNGLDLREGMERMQSTREVPFSATTLLFFI